MGAAAAPRRAPLPEAPPQRRPRTRPRTAAKRRANPALASRSRNGGAPVARAAARAPVARVAQPAMAGVARLPHAAVRTAGAFRDLSDSSLIVRLTQGRGWIGLLCLLLGGIVTLNVIGLSLSAGNGRVGMEIDKLERENSALRAELAEQFSATRVEGAAAELGLAVPDPREVRYMDASDSNLEKLARLLSTGELSGAPTGYEDSTLPASEYAPVAEPSESTTAPAPVPSPSPAPAPEPASPPSASGGGGGAGTGGVGL